MSDLAGKVAELAGLMAEFGLEEARLAGEDWSVELAREPKVKGGIVPMVAAVDAESAPKPPASPARPAPKAAPKGTPLCSPMMGIYYASPSPGSPAFVKEGDVVTAGQVVGLVEAMKVFNEITAPMAGTVLKLTATNGDLLQPGEPILYIG